MTAKDLLNADIGAVGQWILQGFRWWIQELADLVPSRLRRPNRRDAPWLAEIVSETGPIRLWRGAAATGSLTVADGISRQADLVLPASAVLVHEVELPHLSGRDLNRLLDLNIDQFTPFRPEQVYFDTVMLGEGAESGRRRVRLGVVTRARAAALLARATELGVVVERMGLGAGEDGRTLEFDFMRPIRAGMGGDSGGRRRAWLWGACAALLLVNVLVAVLRDMNDVGQLERLVDGQRPMIALATRLRQSVQGEQSRRMALLTRRSVHEPTRILDAVTRALPPGAWVQRMEWNGRAVRLVGLKPPELDVLAALHGAALRNPRSLLSDMPTKTETNQTPFDVLADSAAQASP